jgi:hypothetical protein
VYVCGILACSWSAIAQLALAIWRLLFFNLTALDIARLNQSIFGLPSSWCALKYGGSPIVIGAKHIASISKLMWLRPRHIFQSGSWDF